MRLLLAAATLAAGFAAPARAEEYVDPPHWAVVIDACQTDGHCERFRLPFDADNAVSCAMTGWQRATAWLVEHQGWTLKKQSCAPASEKDA